MQRSVEGEPTLVDKIITTLLDPEVQEAIYTEPNAYIQALYEGFYTEPSETIRFAIAPQTPIYDAKQLNNALTSVATTIAIDQGIKGKIYPAGSFGLPLLTRYFEFGELTYVERGEVAKTSKISSVQPVSKLWGKFGVQIPTYDLEPMETFPRRVIIVMYPDRELAKESFISKCIYRIKMSEFTSRQQEYSRSTLLT